MKFKKGMTVKTADGDKVGTVDQIIVDPGSQDVTHIVVEKGFLFKEDRIVPIHLLREADEDTVLLESSVDDIEEFPQYRHGHFIQYQRQPLPPQWGGWAGGPLLYNPPLGEKPYAYYPGIGFPANHPKHPPEGAGGPAISISIEEGMKVLAENGENAGEVKKTFTDDEGKITHLVISEGFLFTTERLIPINWVSQMTDNEIQLSVPTEMVENQPEYSG